MATSILPVHLIPCKYNAIQTRKFSYRANLQLKRRNSGRLISIITMAEGNSENRSSAVVQERIIIPNKHGEKLVGVLDDTGSRELAVFCHGFRSCKEHNPLAGLATTLTSDGISTFRFDFSGNGESKGQFLYGNYWKEVEDLQSVVLYFTGKERKVNTIIGHSKGGNCVLLYASKYHDIVDTVINISGRYALEKGIEERLGKDFKHRINEDGFFDVKDKLGNMAYRVTKESLMDRLQTDMKSAALSIARSCRVLTIHGSKDEIIPVTDAFEFDKLIPNHTLHVIDGADHVYSFHQNDLAPVILNFMRSG
uniref:Serine aminopeptidase S33 domain-containing protein n=1 Tax=Araucaria cunninghamii TaxID=56994 RepID=A0A0D6R8A1_ARACU